MDFHQIFKVSLEDQDLIWFGVSGKTVAMATPLRFWVLKFVGVPHLRPMHRILPKFKGIFIPIGSTAN